MSYYAHHHHALVAALYQQATTPDPGPRVPYAATFVQAAGLSNATHIQAAYQIENKLIAAGVLNAYNRDASKLKAWYPIIGGTEAAHKINFVNPATYPLTFYNSPAHSSAGGIEFNGTQYADTGFILNSLNGETEGGELLYYALTNTLEIGFEMGALGGTGAAGILMLTLQDEARTAKAYSGQPLTNTTTTITDSRGLFTASFDAVSQTLSMYRNGQLLAGPVPSNGAHPVLPCLLGTFNLNGGAFEKFTRRWCGGAGIATGFTTTERAAFYDAVQECNTTLKRAV